MFAKINGIKVSYQMDGAKGRPCVVLVHGFPFTRATWKNEVAVLKRNFRVLTYDLRGMGGSALGPAPQPLEAYVDDLIALLDHLFIAKAGIAGLSMGGYIALRAIQRNPDRFWALALCDTKAEPDSEEGKLGRAAGIKALHAQGLKPFAQGMLPKLLARPSSPAGKNLLKIMLKNNVAGAANALAAMQGRSDTSPVLMTLAVPVLVLAGDQDQVIPAATVKALAAQIPQAQLLFLKGAGHVANLEDPQGFGQALLEFFTEAYD
jgi:3-oxoadipate enol-lactonase